MNKAIKKNINNLIIEAFGKDAIYEITEVCLDSDKDLKERNAYVRYFGYFDTTIICQYKSQGKTVYVNSTMPSMFDFVNQGQPNAMFIGLRIQFNQPIKDYSDEQIIL